MDGIVEIMEAPGTDAIEHEGGEGRRKHWTDNGMDVLVTLEAGAMEKLLLDPQFGRHSHRLVNKS